MKEQYNTYKNPFCLTEATQHLVYLPFGELRSNREYYNVKYINYYEQHWVDMKYNTSQFDTPYKFNGKEKDPETGLHYYGARYLNSDLSIWLSVDPMSDKYPHLTSYNYCANNPVMLVDPDGREIDPINKTEWNEKKKYANIEFGLALGKYKDNMNDKNAQEKLGATASVLTSMNMMEKSEQVYSLNKGSSLDIGAANSTTYDPKSKKITLSFSAMATFFHEVIHGGQIESGMFGFDKTNGNPIGHDVGDEKQAFKVQEVLFPNSIPDEIKNGNVNYNSLNSIKVGDNSNLYKFINKNSMNGNTVVNGVKLKDNPNNLFIDNRKKK